MSNLHSFRQNTQFRTTHFHYRYNLKSRYCKNMDFLFYRHRSCLLHSLNITLPLWHTHISIQCNNRSLNKFRNFQGIINTFSHRLYHIRSCMISILFNHHHKRHNSPLHIKNILVLLDRNSILRSIRSKCFKGLFIHIKCNSLFDIMCRLSLRLVGSVHSSNYSMSCNHLHNQCSSHHCTFNKYLISSVRISLSNTHSHQDLHSIISS